MPSATLTGTVKLKTGAFQRGLRSIRNDLQRFGSTVGPALGTAARNLAMLTVMAGTAAAAVSKIGVGKVFSFETMNSQFEMLFRNTEKAKKTVGDLIELSAVTPFDVEPYVDAARILQVMGGAALNNKEFITALGDAAAMTGSDLQQVAAWTGEMYASLQSGSVGRGGKMLMRRGILTPQEYNRIKDMAEAGEDLSQTWSLVTTALGRAQGSMMRMSKTGNGLYSTLKGLVNLSLAATFTQMGEQVKGVMNSMISGLDELRKNGTFEAWGEAIAAQTKRVITAIWTVGTAWKNLDENTRSQLKSIIAGGAAFLVIWKTGLLSAMVKTVAASAVLIAGHLALITGALIGVAGFIAGINIGKALTKSTNVSEMLAKFGFAMKALGQILYRTFVNLLSLASAFWDEFKERMSGASGTAGIFGALASAFKDKMTEDFDAVRKEMDAKQAEVDKQREAEGPRPGFVDAYKEAAGEMADAIMDPFLKLVEPVRNFLEEMQNAKMTFEFPEAPKLAPLDEQLNTNKALDDIRKINSASQPLRGIYRTNFKDILKLDPAKVLAQAQQASPAQHEAAHQGQLENIGKEQKTVLESIDKKMQKLIDRPVPAPAPAWG